MSDRVTPLNYSAHALEDLKQFVATLHKSGDTWSASAVQTLIGLLRRSNKFLMPNCCELIDPHEIRQTHLELLRLPFPCTAFEAPWVKEGESVEGNGDFETTSSPKRIALCWDSEECAEALPGLNSILGRNPGGGVVVVPIYWLEAIKQWVPVAGGMFVPYENEVSRAGLGDDAPQASQTLHKALFESGRAKKGAPRFSAEPFVLLPEIFEDMAAKLGGIEQALAQVMFDCHDEVMMLIQACSVLNCANVHTVEVRPDAPINKKRQAKGLQPFFTYKVLQLTDDRGGAAREGGGGHASPRMHLRRGHMRRLENKVTWVRATTVNFGAPTGIVEKDYAVGRKPSDLH